MSPISEACRCACVLAPGSRSDELDADAVGAVSHLYVCEGLSTYRIGAMLDMNRQRVGRLLARAGVPVKPRGAGRRRRVDADQLAADDVLATLYLESGLTSAQIAALTGTPERTVRERLRASGVRMRTRGRLNREDRVSLPVDLLAELYLTAGLSATDVGRQLGVSGQTVLRSAHDQGLPVRIGGPEPSQGPTEIELIDALYADPLVERALARHGIARVPERGPIWQRFPVPLVLSPGLAEELYVKSGLSV
ncbi:MAG TPA: hypothetical protein VH520_05710, partial [Streptosporangiaceae bacterium]